MATKGIKIFFDGKDNTVFDFRSSVTGKELLAQQVLVNIATDAGSDPLYPTRGTTLHRDSINGLTINKVEAQHTGNFAALDTLMFVSSTMQEAEPAVTRDARSVIPKTCDHSTRTLSYEVQMTFSDGTSNPITVVTNG